MIEPVGKPVAKFPHEMSQAWMIGAAIFSASIITMMIGFAIGMHANEATQKVIREEQAYVYHMVGYNCGKNGSPWHQCADDLRRRLAN